MGSEIQVDDYTSLLFLYPQAADQSIDIEQEQNEASLVFILNMYGKHFLFSGDMTAEAEQVILQQLTQHDTDENDYDVPIDVLKVAHHGSKYSTTNEWLNYWQPAYAVISVGRNNTYGHPHPNTIHRLMDVTTQIFVTSLHGEIRMKVLPQSTAPIQIETFSLQKTIDWKDIYEWFTF